jgi:hypothetical protein
MKLFTRNSPHYHLLKYLLFLLKHPVYYRSFALFCTLLGRNTICFKNFRNVINQCLSLSIKSHRIFTNEKLDNTKIVQVDMGRICALLFQWVWAGILDGSQTEMNECELVYWMDHRLKWIRQNLTNQILNFASPDFCFDNSENDFLAKFSQQ